MEMFNLIYHLILRFQNLAIIFLKNSGKNFWPIKIFICGHVS